MRTGGFRFPVGKNTKCGYEDFFVLFLFGWSRVACNRGPQPVGGEEQTEMEPAVCCQVGVGMSSCKETVCGRTGLETEGVKVLYFHGKNRCAACRTIEKEAKAVVEERFSRPTEEGQVLFFDIDLSEKENAVLGKDIRWLFLILSYWENGQETYENLTEKAFAKARRNPEVFRKELGGKVEGMLQ